MERLRHVARAGSVEHAVLVQEAAAGLASLGDDHGGLVLSCKRLLDHHPSSGPLWWLCGGVLCADDPVTAAWRAVDRVLGDRTDARLADAVPDGAVVTVIGWTEIVAASLPRRGDVEVRVVDAGGSGPALVRRLERLDVAAVDVPESGTGAAVAASDLVLVETAALSPGGLVAPSGSRAAAAVAAHAQVPVWAVAGVGRVVAGPIWEVIARRVAGAEPWSAEDEVVPLDLVASVVRPDGVSDPGSAASTADGPVATELLEPLG